jgi:hypothetical protein
MSHRFFQLQTEAAHGSRSSSPHRSSHSHHHKSSSSHHSHRPQPQTTPNYAQRTSTSSETSSGSSSYGSSYSSSSSSNYNYYDPAQQQHYSMDQAQPRVEVMRCSRCAKCVETVTSSRAADGDLRKISTDDASASGMVRFGHNLYYCDRCARMVGYK